MKLSGQADRSIDFVLLDEALHKLASFDERKSRIIELRFFGGLTIEQMAEVSCQTSECSVYREWDLAGAWLFRELTGADRGYKPCHVRFRDVLYPGWPENRI